MTASVDVRVRDLDFSFARLHAVDRVSFDVPAGSVTALLGGNGAGKSTTLRLMLGLVRGRGTTTFGGRALREHPRPGLVVGAFLGAPAFSGSRTTRDHLRLVAAATGQRQAKPGRIEEVLHLMGLEGRADDTPRGFSTGMRQRLGVAAALVAAPRVLVLDEPINGLDPHAVIGMRDLLIDHARSGGTVLMASHVLSEVELVADRAVVMANGRVVDEGSVSGLLGRDDTERSVVECDRANELADVLRVRGATATVTSSGDGDGDLILEVEGLPRRGIAEAAREHGILIWGLRPHRRSLEDVFVHTVGHPMPQTSAPRLPTSLEREADHASP